MIAPKHRDRRTGEPRLAVLKGINDDAGPRGSRSQKGPRSKLSSRSCCWSKIRCRARKSDTLARNQRGARVTKTVALLRNPMREMSARKGHKAQTHHQKAMVCRTLVSGHSEVSPRMRSENTSQFPAGNPKARSANSPACCRRSEERRISSVFNTIGTPHRRAASLDAPLRTAPTSYAHCSKYKSLAGYFFRAAPTSATHPAPPRCRGRFVRPDFQSSPNRLRARRLPGVAS